MKELIRIEVTVSTLGGRVLSTSDDFFASKDNLIKPYVRIRITQNYTRGKEQSDYGSLVYL